MKNNGFTVSVRYRYVLCLILLVFSAVSSSEELPLAYSLGYGDSVSIRVFGEDDLTVETQLNDLGVISFPFLGEIKIFGLTVTEVQEKIKKGLQDGYLVNPKVSVSVTQYRRFYVNGEVRQPGGFAFLPGLTIRKAISLAGGFTARAAQRKIFVVSDGSSEKESKRVDLNSSVNPGDVITVKARFF